MRIKKKALLDMAEDLHRALGEINGLREEARILKRSEHRAKSEAAGFKKLFEDKCADIERTEATLSNFARFNKMLRDKLEAAGIEAPTYVEFLNMEKEKED